MIQFNEEKHTRVVIHENGSEDVEFEGTICAKKTPDGKFRLFEHAMMYPYSEDKRKFIKTWLSSHFKGDVDSKYNEILQ